jgi:CRP-like cAMP-binding protein
MSLKEKESPAVPPSATALMDKRTPTRTRRLRRLAETGWLALQPPDFQDRMASLGRWISVPKGKAIYRFGDNPDAIFGLGERLVDISLPIDDEEEVIVHRAPPGYWIGDWALLSGLPRLVTLTAATDCRFFRIPHAPLLRMLEDNPKDWRCLYHLATLNGGLATQALAETLVLPPRPRFARVLLRLALPDGTVSATQEELGRMAGMSRAAFRRALRALIRAGVLETGRGTVRILDRAALERTAQESGD